MAFGKGLLIGAIIGGALGFVGGVALGALSLVASPAIVLGVGIGLLGFGIYSMGKEIHTLLEGEEDGRKIGELETYERSGNLLGSTLSGGLGAKYGFKWGASKVAKLRIGSPETSNPGNSPATGQTGEKGGNLATKTGANQQGEINPSWPRTREALHEDLQSKGYRYNGKSPEGYEVYKGSEGRKVTVKPDGEVIPTQRVWASDDSRKFPQRQDYDGNPLPDQKHSTGHYIE